MSSVAAVSEWVFIAHNPWVVRFIRRGKGCRSQPSPIAISEYDLDLGDATAVDQREMSVPAFTE